MNQNKEQIAKDYNPELWIYKVSYSSNASESVKEDLPKGKLSIRYIQSRGVLQAYAGGKYLLCISGDTIEDVIRELKNWYNVPAGTKITDHSSIGVTVITL